MATKKQKRLAGAERAKIQAEQERNLGLKAQEADRARRAIQAERAAEDMERELAKVRRQKKASGFADLSAATNRAIVAMATFNAFLSETSDVDSEV